MSISGFQDYTQPLTLLGETTIKGTLNAKNVYVSGTITGAGISTNILNTDNTWTGTNNFTQATTYTGGNPVVSGDELTTKQDVDDAIASYNVLTNPNNYWTYPPTFSNADPPTIPTYPTTLLTTQLVGLSDLNTYITTTPNSLLGTNNTFTGTNTFSNTFSVGSLPLQVPTQPQQLASKAYVDGKIEVAGKTLTYTILTPGTYNFPNINRTNVAKLEYILFGGSNVGASGAVVSGTIGNALGANGSLVLNVGIASPTTNYTTYDQNVASTTSLLVSNQLVAGAGGACILNGVNVRGSPLVNTYNGQNGLSANGEPSADNILKYGSILGTTTSAGGAILVAQFI